MKSKQYKTILLDLDDTLFDEFSYVKSGFIEVCLFIASYTNIDSNIILDQMLYQYYKYGRSGVFNRTLSFFEIGNIRVDDLVSVYRNHNPKIKLYDGVFDRLVDLKKRYNLAIITDGISDVQCNKIKSLELDNLIEDIFYCYKHNSPKPSPHTYFLALKRFDAKKEHVLIIGDDPYCDIAAANNLNIDSFRVRTGKYKNIECLTIKPTAEFESFVCSTQIL